MPRLTRRQVLAGSAATLALTAYLPTGFAYAEEPGKPGGTLVIVSSQVPRHLNGAVQSGIATAVPSTQLFASPLRYDANWKPHPYLAEKWDVAEDGLSVTLHLVKDATFHDGKPITSEDVAFSIMTIKANHPFKTMFAPVKEVETPDPQTAVIKLEHPHPALLLCMSPALCPILPKHVFGEVKDIRDTPLNSKPVGSGPFMFESFTPGQSIVLKKNPNFFLKGLPYLDKIIINIIPDPSALVLTVQNGSAGMAPFLSGPDDIKRLEKVAALSVTAKGYEGIGPINWLAFNTKAEKLKDVRVRQAIGYAIDRNFITKALMRGTAQPQFGPIIDSSPFADAKIPHYDVDLDKAKALMKEAGHEKGMDLTVDYLPGAPDQQKNVAEYLKSQLKKVGINVTVRASPDFPTWARRISNYDYEMSMDLVFNWGDPVIGVARTYVSSNIVKGVIWSNTAQYDNPKVDTLLHEAGQEMNTDKRKTLYDEFQMIVGHDLPIYWINAVPYHTVFDKRLGNPPETIWGPMSPMDTVYWKEKA